VRAEGAASRSLAVGGRHNGRQQWKDGLDVVVERDAERVEGRDGFGHTDDSGDSHIAFVYRVPPAKVLAFAKSPHGQTTFRF
jgi:hypothetical protein